MEKEMGNLIFMLNLNNIELISVNCVYPEDSVKALLYSSKDINFSKIKLISHYKPANLPSHIEYIQIEKQTHHSMNKFSINELPLYLSEDYALSIHDDGFIINSELWSYDFLKYDYIGAPWPNFDWCQINRVGNGGFVLKSKKFYKLEQKITQINGHNDVVVTNTYYNYFINNECKYASLDVACKFALEIPIPECEYNLEKCFGFHGKHTQHALEKIKIMKDFKY
jgi:hypothetical protein